MIGKACPEECPDFGRECFGIPPVQEAVSVDISANLYGAAEEHLQLAVLRGAVDAGAEVVVE